CGGEPAFDPARHLDAQTAVLLQSFDPAFRRGQRRALMRSLWRATFDEGLGLVVTSLYLGGETLPSPTDALAISRPSDRSSLRPRSATIASAVTARAWALSTIALHVPPSAALLERSAERMLALADEAKPLELRDRLILPLRPDVSAEEDPN